MFRLTLINMPFSDRCAPSFALSQLASVMKSEFGNAVETEVLYPNQEFALFLGAQEYDALATGLRHHTSGLGDWLFRQIAFPESEDNTEAYLRRYYAGPENAAFRDLVREKRSLLPAWCASLVEKHGLLESDALGFTSMFNQSVPSLAIAGLVKAGRPGILTMMGGANCEAPMGAALIAGAPQLDFVMSGPALRTLPALMRALLDGDTARSDTIPGVLTRRNFTDERHNTSMGAERPLNEVVVPDFGAFRESFDRYRAEAHCEEAEATIFVETSRGCWWGERSHCTFCGLNGGTMNYRAMAAKRALDVFALAFEHYPWCRNFVAVDNIMPMDYLDDVFPELRTPAGASLFYEVKANLDQHDMAVLKAAGVNEIQPGIESLSTATLKLMRKGSSAFRNIGFLKNCAMFDIMPEWNLLIGFPGEEESTYEKYCQDMPRLMHLPPPSGAYMVRFDRYSPYFQSPDEFGLELNPADHYHYTYPFDAATLEQLAYYFTDQSLSPYMVAAAQWSGRLNALIQEWRERWEDTTGNRARLHLVVEDGGARIHDSRSGSAKVVDVDEAQLNLLKSLGRSRRIAEVTAAPETEAAYGFLRDHALLFIEGDRVMSLVTDDLGEDPSPRLQRGQVRPRDLVLLP